MDRSQAIDALADFAGPLGPFRTPEDQGRRRAAWLAGLDLAAAEVLLDILLHPPDRSEYTPSNWETFEWELSEALVASGQREPQRLLERVGPLLDDGRARPALIDVIGGLGLPEGVQWLEPLIAELRLTTDELVRLADAFGEIGGDEARVQLERLRLLPGATDEDVRNEIEIALSRA